MKQNRYYAKWFNFWDQNGFFKANINTKKPPYCIVIPPSNVTGSLHMGHVYQYAAGCFNPLEGMSGFEALWVPGTDHAGISTQTVVERHLIKTTEKNAKISHAKNSFNMSGIGKKPMKTASSAN